MKYLVVAGNANEFHHYLKKLFRIGEITKEDINNYTYVHNEGMLMGHNPNTTDILFWGQHWNNPIDGMAYDIKRAWDANKNQ